ncbi:sulfatase-like hydrolase/transferase [Nocardioides sp. Iso805N]|uniref:sulfatase-like hydrolase/transferase n=1 Tax=Nocardioides sp. Iso805N TaxID=1283287 RepID=UPI00037DAE74|nr:sulfatase-like hydrolase/transferase [Nocardioides sp. Iso805N]
MRSRATLATLAVGALAVSGLFGHTARKPQPVAASPSPNILLITADDLAVHDLDYMPNTRRLLADEGVTFSDGIAPTPLCVPARASLLSGQYAHNHGARTISGPYGGYQSFDDHDTIATALQEAGYRTMFAGKYLNGYGKDGTELVQPTGWNQWRATVDPSTYRFVDPKMNIDGVLKRESGYTTDVMTRQSDSMIGGAAKVRKKTGQPWFEWLNYVAPHVGGPAGPDDPVKRYAGTDAAYRVTVPAARDRNTLRDVRLPTTPDMFPEDTHDLPPGSPRHKRFTQQQKDALRMVYQRRLETVLSLDRAVGHDVATLRRTGQLASTLIIFTSDNGYTVGSSNINGKLWHYDPIISIPVLMRGPGVPRGTTTRTPITNPDIAATILAAAHATPPRPLDGVDLLPWLDRPAQLRVIPIEAWKLADGSQQLYWGVRAGAWTYARLRGGNELFDRSTDPYELRNLAADPAYHVTLVRLRELARRYRTCAGDTCPKTFTPLKTPDQLPQQGAT